MKLYNEPQLTEWSALSLFSKKSPVLWNDFNHGIHIPIGSQVEDFEIEALPVTPSQLDILAETGLERSAWVKYTFSFLNLRFARYDRLRMTWQAIASCNPVLRTYLANGGTASPLSIHHQVLRRALPMRFCEEIPQGISAPYLVYNEADGGLSTLTLHIHPALIDELSLEKLRDDFQLFYNGYSIPFRIPFQIYVRDVHHRHQDDALKYWHQVFSSFRPKPVFESQQTDTSETRSITTINVQSDLFLRLSQFETSYHGLSEPLILAAWGIVISRHINMEDVAFKTSLRDNQAYGSDDMIAFLEVNVPLRLKIDPNERVLELLSRIQQSHASAQKFGYIGYRKIESLYPSFKRVQTSIRKVNGARRGSPNHYRSSDLAVEIDIASNQVIAHHSLTAVTAAWVTLMIDHFLQALHSMLLDPGGLVGNVSLVSVEEESQLIEIGKAKKKVVPGLAHELIERQCEASPLAPAVHHLNQQSITYSQLNSMANQLARQLQRIIGQNMTIAVHMEVGTHLIVSLLAILKAGGNYVILDPSHPRDRKQFVMKDSNAKFCIAESKDLAQITNINVEVSVISVDLLLDTSEDHANLNLNIDIETPAYIIYTSGSTGRPKGVVLSHRAVSSGISCARDLPTFRSLLFYNPVFSAAQRTILSTLAHGGCLCLASGSDIQVHLTDTIRSLQVNNLGITSSTMSLVDPARVPTLREVTVTGEAMDPSLISIWGNRVSLRNNYGLSECTQLNWGAQLSAANSTSRSIGFADDTTSAYIIDPDGTALTPFLVPGELCLSGPQLATGYRNQPELTAAVFLPNPFSPGEILYRTGDMAVRLEDGSVEIIGRKDSQIKINGQRVEPSEVQSVLRSHEGIDSIAVVAATLEGRKSLVACIVVAPGWVWTALILKLRAIAVGKLPAYMVPKFWMEVSSLPVNRNGKTDINSIKNIIEKKSMAELIGNSIASEASNNKALTEVELILQSAVAKSLDLSVDMVNIDNSFLAFGGDSLRAINIVSELLKKGYSVDVADIVLSESLSKTATTIKEIEKQQIETPKPFSMVSKDSEISLELYDDVYPATPLQESVVSAHISKGIYLYDRVFRIDRTDVTRLKTAFEAVVREYPIYRTTFIQAQGSYMQGVIKHFNLPWHVYKGMSVQEVQKLTSEDKMELSHPFIRALQVDDNFLIIRIHHALFDFWSSRFLFDDVAKAYENKPLPFRPSFNCFVREVLTINSTDSRDFWATYLQAVPSTKLETKSVAAFNSASLTLSLDIRSLATSARLTIGALAYASWALILWKHTGNQDITFAVTLSGRDTKIRNIQDLNGPTLVTVPFRVHVEPTLSLLDFAREIQTKIWEVARYSQFGMRKALEVSGHHISPFDTMVNFLVKNDSDVRTELVLPSYGGKPIWETGLTTFELEESGHGALEVRISGRLEPIRTKFIAEQVSKLLTALTSDGKRRIDQFDFVSTSEAVFLEDLSSNVSRREATLLHHPFERIAASKPNGAAIEFEGEQVATYSQLNVRANRIARQLVKYGIGPDVLVPICLAKSIEAVVCILAVLKAGGAFVPLDPDNPPERNNFIVNDVAASIVLTDENYASIFATQASNVQILDVNFLDQIGDLDENLYIPALTPDHLAYAIYTSGSTGVPKGVLIPHKSIAAGIESIIAAEGVDSSWRNLQFSNFVFDVAIGDIFCTFGVGAILCMAPFERMLSNLADVVNSMKITRLFLTPTVARLLCPEEVPSVEGIYLAGELVTQDLVETWTPYCTVMNCYGPTEASILSVAGEIERGGNSRVIGRPLKTTSGWILNPESLDIVPYGAIGELCLGGTQLARGYLNRPEVTNSAFVIRDGQRLYRTGDLARWVESGKIECFGRLDNQAKVNGHRIEIGEIESAILATGTIHDVAVLVVEVKGKSQIVAFCVLGAGIDQNTDSHRETLALLSISLTSLPPYMVPQIWIPIASLPRLPSGKNDRKGLMQKAHNLGDELQTYSIGGSQPTEMKEAVTNEQVLLQSLWGNLFGIDPKSISITSAFFSQGGDSISAINLVGKCRGKGYILSVSDVLAHPVLQDMALQMRPITHKQEEYLIPRIEGSSHLKLELSKAGIDDEDIQCIWPVAPGIEEFLIRGAEKEQFWQCQTVRRVPKDFDFILWGQVATQLAQNNDILRSMWVQDEEKWLQIVLSNARVDIATVECNTEKEAKEAIAESWASRFELTAGNPFVRYRLIVTQSTGTRDLLIKIHHAMYDGTLLRILDDQFRALHRQQQLPPSVQFSKYVGYLNATKKHQTESLAFWKDLHANRPLPYPQCSNPTSTGMVLESIDSKVDAFAAQCGVTAPIVFQTAFTLLLAKLSGQSDVSYDNLITGRNINMEDAQTINGNCANFLPFRSIISPDITIRKLLVSTQTLFWKTTEYGDVNTTQIYDACGQTRGIAANRAMFLFQPFEPVTGSVKHMRWMVMAGSSAQMPVDYALYFEVSKTASGYKLTFKYDVEVYSSNEAGELAKSMIEILQGMMARSFLPAQDFFM